MASMDDRSVLEADEDGLSMDSFVAGGTYTLSLVQPGEGSPLKRRRVEPPVNWHHFVQSAAKHYEEWRESEAAARGDSADVEKDSTMKFLTVSGDPLSNFWEGWLLGVRECYKHLKEILVNSKGGERFILLGTSGVGKSCFAVFWVCYQATVKKKVVWRVQKHFYLLDFSSEAPKVDGPLDELDPSIQEVFRDRNAWVILDGGQEGGFVCCCHVLVPCCDDKKNYAEFLKGQNVSKLYCPVWEEQEISQFVEAFEVRRADYSWMLVPAKEEAMKYFGELGGVARYVLCSKHTCDRLGGLERALQELDSTNCVKILRGDFEGLGHRRDVVVHMCCGQDIGDNHEHGQYSACVWKLATSGEKEKVLQILDEKFNPSSPKGTKSVTI